MMCFEEGILQAYLDNELENEDKNIIESHLATCPDCRKKLKQLQDNQSLVNECLEKYRKGLERISFNHETGWERFAQIETANVSNKKGVFKMNRKYKKWVAAAAVVATLAGSLSFSPVRLAAAELLNIFRAEKVQTIAISEHDMYELENKIREGAGEINLEDFGKIETNDKWERQDITQQEALAEETFAVKLPVNSVAGFEGQFSKQTGNRLDFTLNVDNTNQLLTSLGSEHLLPQEIDNKTFSISIGDTIEAYYSNHSDKNYKYINIIQCKSPEISVPKDVDIIEMRDALLDIPILPADLKRQLRGVTDFEHTLLIPNPDGKARDVSVNGKPGVFMGDEGHYGSLMWLDDGVLRVINGNALTLQQALEIAAEMR